MDTLKVSVKIVALQMPLAIPLRLNFKGEING